MQLPQFPAHPDCTRCNARESQCRTVGMATISYPSLTPSPHTPALMVVGQAPSFHEDKAGRPWFGDAGNYLKEVYLNGVSLPTRTSIFLTNALRCRTGFRDPPPTRGQINACRPHFEADLAQIAGLCDPNQLYLLLCGGPAVTLALGGGSLRSAFRRNGSTIQLGDHKWTWVATYNPAFILKRKSPSHIRSVDSHLTILSNRIDGVEPAPTKPVIIPPRSPRRV